MFSQICYIQGYLFSGVSGIHSTEWCHLHSKINVQVLCYMFFSHILTRSCVAALLTGTKAGAWGNGIMVLLVQLWFLKFWLELKEWCTVSAGSQLQPLFMLLFINTFWMGSHSRFFPLHLIQSDDCCLGIIMCSLVLDGRNINVFGDSPLDEWATSEHISCELFKAAARFCEWCYNTTCLFLWHSNWVLY